MTLEELKKKCISSGRSLQWMLSVLSEEEVLLRLSAGLLGESSLIKGEYMLFSAGGAPSPVIPKLEFVTQLPEGRDLIREILSAGEQEMEIPEISEVNAASSGNDRMYIVRSLFHGIPASFYMKVTFLEDRNELERSLYGISANVGKKEILRLSGEGSPIVLSGMSPEGILVERYMEAAREGELIDSMETWYDLFYIATAFSLKGHRLGEILTIAWEGGIDLMPEALKKSKSLGSRWRAFARENKVPLRGFPDLVDYLSSVTGPVIGAVKEGKEFFGQWMPELCRYID